MMNYDVFKKAVEDTFKDYLPEKYREMSVSVCPVRKVNAVLDAINLTNQGNRRGIYPIIYINDMYEHYKSTADFRMVLQAAADMIENCTLKESNIDSMCDFSKIEENVVIQLVNTERNRSMLADMPHRRFGELSIVYRWILGRGSKDETFSALVNHRIAEQAGMYDPHLFKAAIRNTRCSMELAVGKMFDVIYANYMHLGVSEELTKLLLEQTSDCKDIYMIKDKLGNYGSAFMLFHEIWCDLAEEIGDDLYIAPLACSWIAVMPVSVEFAQQKLKKLVSDFFACEEFSEDCLSEQIYFYDRNAKQLGRLI